MNRERHQPVRSCVGCGQRDTQSVMLRIVRIARGQLALDPDRHAGGRGAYLHDAGACWEIFARRKGMIRSLGVSVDRDARAALLEDLRSSVGGMRG